MPTAVGVVKRMVEAHQGKHKDLVKFMVGQTCLVSNTIRVLLRTLDLKAKTTVNGDFTEEQQPTIFTECLGAKDPEAMAKKAIAEDLTASQVRQAVQAEKRQAQQPPPLPPGQFALIYADPRPTGKSVRYRTFHRQDKVCVNAQSTGEPPLSYRPNDR